HALLTRRGVPESTVAQLRLLGFSSICNLLASIKTARHYELGTDDVVLTCFTDSVELYRTRLAELTAERGRYDDRQAEVDFERRLLGTTTDHLRELTFPERKAVHNLKYFTWVEQQGKTVEELDALWAPGFWRDLQARLPEWDAAIAAFNRDTGVLDKIQRGSAG
ncbi:MAG: hypothetical protein MUO25_08450, partial [Thermoanaerobaculaceae bacterium]|nr:hypothetical protein [Thermoanaerobaculaceae bacterium]